MKGEGRQGISRSPEQKAAMIHRWLDELQGIPMAQNKAQALSHTWSLHFHRTIRENIQSSKCPCSGKPNGLEKCLNSINRIMFLDFVFYI